MRINRENTIAVVIDMQEKLLSHIENHEAIKDNCIKLIRGLKIMNVPMLVTQQYTKGLGPTITEITAAIENLSYIEKTAFSCYREPNFVDLLQASAKRNVIIVGVESHVCVLQTTLDLIYNNYNPIVLTDATGSRHAEDRRISHWRMRDVGAIMSTTESILFELLKQAGSDEFKAISKLLK